MSNLLWQKAKPSVMQITFFTVIGLVAWFGARPLLSTIQTKMDDIQKLAFTREHREKQLERLPDLEAQHAIIDEHDERLEIILTKDRLVEFIETLERLAVDEEVVIEIESRENAFLESKVTVKEKKETPAKTATPADKSDEVAETPKKAPASKETGIITELPLKKFLKLTITVTGKYGNIVRYLHRVETLPYALDVIGMNIKERPSDADRITLGSGTLNPFGESAPVQTEKPKKVFVLDAVFDTVVYMRD